MIKHNKKKKKYIDMLYLGYCCNICDKKKFISEIVVQHKKQMKLVLDEFKEVLLHPDNIIMSLRLGMTSE